jgi:CheY-like chemotaxis protein
VLRFQNEALIRRLEDEMAIAQTARVAAEHANEAKSRFLAAASHDLRQPVHAQGLFLELLARSALDKRQREIVANARLTLDASSEMLDALLDFSRIEAGVVQPQVRAFALEPLLQRIETEFAPVANQRELSYRSRETKAMVRSDPALVSLIIRNFVSNAIRYTDRGGLFVGVRSRRTHVVVEVWDTGIGVPSDQRREIFREFHQLGNPERDRRKGLGLGLAIAGGLATLLGHDIEVKSIPGRGSVFRLMLPCAAELALPVLPEPERSSVSREAERTDDDRSPGLRILLIDDDPTILLSMRQLLVDWSYVCDVAESTEEALAAASMARPDIIVSDFRLRGQENGVEAIAAVRALAGAHIPALLITGDTAPERLREARASNIPVLHKPVSPAQMHTQLRLLVPQPGSSIRVS